MSHLVRILSAASCAAFVLLTAGSGHARTLEVGRDADTVSATLDLSADGDIVVVPEGIWPGRVRIENRITLRGPGTIDGGGEGTVVTVVAAGAVIDGLTVRGSGSDLSDRDSCIYTEATAEDVRIVGSTIRDCAFGIWINQSPRAHVIGNHVFGRADRRPADRGNGIHLFDADHLVIQDNVIQGARDGIYVSATDDSLIQGNQMNGQRYGVHYMYSYRNTLIGNTANGNSGGFALMQSRGLLVEGNVAMDNDQVGLLFRDAQECRIIGNRLERNAQGMFFFSSTENIIHDNFFVGNQVGAKIWAGSLRNDVQGNHFIGNAQQVFYVGAHDLLWGEDGHGNHFSDYVGWDQDGDGIGDRPHRVDSFSANLLHRYPSAVLLVRSPVLELLAHLEARMPILRVATVVDLSPVVSD